MDEWMWCIDLDIKIMTDYRAGTTIKNEWSSTYLKYMK